MSNVEQLRTSGGNQPKAGDPVDKPLTTPETAGGGPPEPPIGERLAKIEGQMESLKRGQDIVLGVVALLVVLFIYLLTRVDLLTDRVNDMPAKISADIRDITRTLSSAITATKQQAPQVLLVPAPQPQPVPKKGP